MQICTCLVILGGQGGGRFFTIKNTFLGGTYSSVANNLSKHSSNFISKILTKFLIHWSCCSSCTRKSGNDKKRTGIVDDDMALK